MDALAQVESNEFPECFKDGLDGGVAGNHPIDNLPPLAKLVAWLILTHHKLPLYPKWKESSPPSLQYVEHWFSGKSSDFDAIWNSHNCKENYENQEKLIKQNWTFKKLPVESMQWRSKACMVASEARVKLQLWLQQDSNWIDEQLFTTHLSRLCLTLADHYYSSQEKVTDEWRNPNYDVYANTDRGTGQLKQQLDEHHIGVAHHAKNIAKALPKLNASLRSLESNDYLSGSVTEKYKNDFGWQDDAKKLAKEMSKTSIEQGFFGINMASTGKGKTLANAKIMYALASETGRIRFSVALGLRALTLQTGREYRDILKLSNENLAIAVGSTAVKQLFENEQNKINSLSKEQSDQQGTGSESQNEFLDADLYVDYTGDIYEHSLSEWTKKNKPLNKLILAPVLVSTIDHLMPATEGTKGGKQIPAMLRLLSSDLVLDEPDDFGLEDLPALCRLVNWAAMLGSRVLLSTATMPPALAYALFQAYQAGWGEYAKANIDNWNGEIACAWFDEDRSTSEQHRESDSFKKSHEKFVKKRIKYLEANAKPQRQGAIVTVEKLDTESAITCIARVIQRNIIKLHKIHHQTQNNKNISIGLARMANINPLVAVTKEMLKLDAPEDTCIHYCVYHSRYPLAIRSHLENKLDNILNRKNPDELWMQDEIKNTLQNHPQNNHIFVVLASPVAEVGRDHDYDWAVVEPSSMRSIIQLAGRVLRHRDHSPTKPNILLWNKNYKALLNKEICFEKPGFESGNLKMIKSHDLNEILNIEQYQNINAIQRITMSSDRPQKNYKGECLNIVELEHEALMIKLFSENIGAKLWWKKHPHWCGEIQRQQRFRDSRKDEAYYLCIDGENSEPYWQWKNENVFPPKLGEPSGIEFNDDVSVEFGENSYFWFDLSAKTIYSELASDPDIEIDDLLEISHRFGEVRLIEYDENKTGQYSYHENLGLYQEIGAKDE